MCNTCWLSTGADLRAPGVACYSSRSAMTASPSSKHSKTTRVATCVAGWTCSVRGCRDGLMRRVRLSNELSNRGLRGRVLLRGRGGVGGAFLPADSTGCPASEPHPTATCMELLQHPPATEVERPCTQSRLICWYFRVNHCHAAFPPCSSQLIDPPYTLAKTRGGIISNVTAKITNQEHKFSRGSWILMPNVIIELRASASAREHKCQVHDAAKIHIPVWVCTSVGCISC